MQTRLTPKDSELQFSKCDCVILRQLFKTETNCANAKILLTPKMYECLKTFEYLQKSNLFVFDFLKDYCNNTVMYGKCMLVAVCLFN